MKYLIDAGPMIALIDGRDADHARCAKALANLANGKLSTTWPCLVEALHILRNKAGWPGQDALWARIVDDTIEVASLETNDLHRCRNLMQKYVDAPMDFGDASLVVLAEKTGARHVITLDRHFYAYRPLDIEHFTIIP